MTYNIRSLLACVGVICIVEGSALSRSHAKAPTPEVISTLKAGQWIQLEGTPQKDGLVSCTEVKLLTGDFLDDDWHLRGIVQSIDRKTQEFTVFKVPARLKDQVEYDDSGASKFNDFSDLRIGMLVKLEGTYMKDGSFLCKEIDDETQKVLKRPGLDKKIQMVARIERVNATKRSITAMGTTFLVSEDTKLKSVIK